MKIIISLLLSLNIIASDNVINLAATEWCPYSCSSHPTEGIVSKYLKEILKKHGYTLNVTFLPWARAVASANSGAHDGLLTAVKAEAPKLKFLTTPTMTYNSCVFSPKRSLKKLSDFSELRKFRLGAISDYSYGKEIDKYIKTHKNKVMKIKGEDSLLRLYKMAKIGRIDFFVEDINVARTTIKEEIVPILCEKETPFFVAFNPRYKLFSKLKPILEKELSSNKNLLKEIIANH